MVDEKFTRTTYASPGVYVEESEQRSRSIEAATTSVAAFVGISAEASRKEINPQTGKRRVVESLLNQVVLVTNWAHYVDFFGSFIKDAYLTDSIYGYFANGGGPCYVISIYAVNEPPTEGKPQLRAIDFIGNVTQRTGIKGLEVLDIINLILCPDAFYGYDGSPEAVERVKLIQTEMITHCENAHFRFALLDTPPGYTVQEVEAWRQDILGFDTTHAALYYPWVEIPNLSGAGTKYIPPSGLIAGVYHRSDEEYGVHKAPANEIMRGVVGLDILVSQAEQIRLNPIGINCIRAFPGIGIRVWGARTLSRNAAWRYINVRRLFNMIGESLDQGLQWVVFEPNNRMLWAFVRRDVTVFLRRVWQSGALMGDTQDEAFYVKIDDEVNPPEIRELGQLIIEIGISPVKPAEYIVLRLSQWAGADAET
ncbi:MAG: phage tail sheath family protein [Candidatus Promineifilaceae bacterium]